MEGSSYIYNAQKREVIIIDKNKAISLVRESYGANALRQLPPSWFINLQNNSTYDDIINNDNLKKLFSQTHIKNVYHCPLRTKETLIIAFDKTLQDIQKMVGVDNTNTQPTNGPKVYVVQWKEAPFDKTGWDISGVYGSFQKAESSVTKNGFRLIFADTKVYENANKTERLKITEQVVR